MSSRPRVHHRRQIPRKIVRIPARRQRERKRQRRRHLWLSDRLPIFHPLPVNRHIFPPWHRIQKRLAVVLSIHSERRHPRHHHRARLVRNRHRINSPLCWLSHPAQQVFPIRRRVKCNAAALHHFFQCRPFRAFPPDRQRL